MMRRIVSNALLAILLSPGFLQADGPDRVFADFEGDNYGDWQTTGTAFGPGPARGTLPGQMEVTGFVGRGLVNSFRGGDDALGTLTSPPFTIQQRSILFLIGGGGYAGKTCINLLIDGEVVRSATGPNTEPGGTERLEPAGWDVREFQGKTARIEIVDDAKGGWGHINVDHIVFSDRRPPPSAATITREIVATDSFLHFPVKAKAARRKVTVLVGGKPERVFDIELADGAPDWWAPLDISAWKGQTLTIRVDRLPAGSEALNAIEQGDGLKGMSDLYREPLRPQLHFSPRRGWCNDPNGLVYYRGEYHLFFQHNPYGTDWGNMHWGHAVSRDLVAWRELGEVLYPDPMGPMFSGSAVVDVKNTSGLGGPGQAPLVLAYTAAGNPAVQCLASSTDGRTFAKYPGNPVVSQFSPGNRDPRVFWHAPTSAWVMVLYVERDQKHTLEFLTSPDLKKWTSRSRIEGFYECPDLFELPVDGVAGKTRWVLTAASSEYMVGAFDGVTFTPETAKLPGHRGRGFYAAQTFNDAPRTDCRLQIGWLQAASPGMPFNQAMSLPLELRLVSTPAGPRLTWTPARELEKVRTRTVNLEPRTLAADEKWAPGDIKGELLDVQAVLEPGKASEVVLDIRGVPIRYDNAAQQLIVEGHRTPVPLRDGRVDVRVLTDRTAFEIFADHGLVYMPMPVIPRADNLGVSLTARGAPARVHSLAVHELRSIWSEAKAPGSMR